ncbi:MAG: bifunctional folylpolyglutamate synthase/dihydrofolate synthase [Fimbriimonas sp.]
MTYQEALDYIASLAPRGWRLGLDRMQAFCEKGGLQDALGAAGGPQYVHVAGTNGKGSTTAYLQSMMVEAGVRTGAFFSPYVVDPRERVQLGRELIAPEELATITEELRPIAEAFTETDFGGISEFEFKTAVGFRCWQRNRSEWVALEVGLGGRLDATNVVTSRASIIVSIGLDHTNLLGETLEEIAFEKAGIIKPGVSVVVGAMEEGPRRVIEEVAHQRGAPVWRYGADVRWEDGEVVTPRRRIAKLRPGIVGEMQGHNLALAVAGLEAAGLDVSDDAVRRGAAQAYVPGRFELREVGGRPVLFDGAHNEDSARVLRATLDRAYPGVPVVLVTNMLQGHDIEAFYSPLMDRVASVHVVPIGFHRARTVAETVAALRGMLPVHPHDSVSAGLAAALSEEGIVLVTGSFYLVGEAVQSLSNREPV